MEKKGEKPTLPLWLSPTQMRLIPVKPEFTTFCGELATKLDEANMRADIDDRDETVDKRVRDAEMNWIPYIGVVGKRETETGLLSVRRRQDGKQYTSKLSELEEEVRLLTKGYPRMRLKLPVLVSQRPGYKQL